MATTILMLNAGAFIGDQNGLLDAGDDLAEFEVFQGRPGLTFDDTDEEAVVSEEVPFPQGVTGTLTAKIHFFMKSDVTNDVALEIGVEAKTPDSDTLDMEAVDSFDTVNAGTVSLSGTTAGDPLVMSITLTNKDNVAAGDLVRFAIRRDTDSANDDAVGDLVLLAVEIQEA